MSLIGGTLYFHILQNFFSFDSRCTKECKDDFNKNFTYDVLEQNLFYVKRNNAKINKNLPIIIFFCGLGVKNVQYRLKDFIEEGSCTNPIIFSMHLNNIHDINEMIERASKLFDIAQGMYPENKFVFVGHSLGSGIAVQTCLELFKRKTQPHITQVLLISTYPNLSYTFEKTYFKNFINYSFNNILDNENALIDLQKKSKQKNNFVTIIQGNKDSIFNFKHLQKMILNNSLSSFVSLNIINGDHFSPAEFHVWKQYLC